MNVQSFFQIYLLCIFIQNPATNSLMIKDTLSLLICSGRWGGTEWGETEDPLHLWEEIRTWNSLSINFFRILPQKFWFSFNYNFPLPSQKILKSATVNTRFFHAKIENIMTEALSKFYTLSFEPNIEVHIYFKKKFRWENYYFHHLSNKVLSQK